MSFISAIAAAGEIGAGIFGAVEAGGASLAGLVGGAGSAITGGLNAVGTGISSAVGGAGEALGLEGLAGAEAVGKAGESSLAGLLQAPGGPFAGLGGGEGFGSGLGQQALGYTPEFNQSFDAFSGVSGGGKEGLAGVTDAAGAAVGQGTGDALGTVGKSALDTGAEGGSFWDKIVGGTKDSIMKNPIGVGLAGAGLGYNMLTGSRQSPEMKALAGQAGQLNQQQAQLMSYLQKGTLPPGLQQGVQNATAAMKAKIISNHARNGMNTDPSQNSALAQELGNVDRYAIELIAKEGVALMNSGLQAAGISSNLYAMLEKIHMQQAQSTGQAIANFAAALSGGPKINVIGGSGMGMAA